MAELHILFGFKEDQVTSKILTAIRAAGYTVSYVERTTKESISDYLKNNQRCTCAVLRECMGAEIFTAEEFSELTDTRDINLVPIIEKEHKGTRFMEVLYAAGITSAIMVGHRHGAEPGQIAELLLHKRNRKQARRYYGIHVELMKIDVLTYDEYVKNYSVLMDESHGLNLIDRYIGVVKMNTPKQVAEFTYSLPINIRKELQSYEEFWIVMGNLKRYGINIKGTRPSVLKKGLTDQQFREAIGSLSKEHRAVAGPRLTRVHSQQMKQRDSGPDVGKQEVGVQSVVSPTCVAGESTGVGRVVTSGGSSSDSSSVASENISHLVSPIGQVGASPKPVSRSVAKPVPKKGEVGGSKPVAYEDNGAVKEKKKKYGINWKPVIFTLVVGILLLVLWYYLVYVLRV